MRIVVLASSALGLRRFAKAPAAGGVFQEIGCAGGTFGGLVTWLATSRLQVRYCGARRERRSATSESCVLTAKGRPNPTFSCSTEAAHMG